MTATMLNRIRTHDQQPFVILFELFSVGFARECKCLKKKTDKYVEHKLENETAK